MTTIRLPALLVFREKRFLKERVYAELYLGVRELKERSGSGAVRE